MNRKALEEIILNINDRTSIRNEILEKDYYVCLVLKSLASKQNELQTYFKGGTAVYKILNRMNRFSEDIDLTVKIDDSKSKNSNKTRLKKSALDYKINGLELMKDETIDRKGSITAFYKYTSLFSFNELFKSERIQIESTSFTISEPIDDYLIEPLIYTYATEQEKKILENDYNIKPFKIKIIKLERIFVDKLFAAEFYYKRNMYEDTSKHLYDIAVLMNTDDIKLLLNNKKELVKLIAYKRKEEKNRIGGISDHDKICDFQYMKCIFDDKLTKAYEKMQNVYVLNENSKIDIKDVKKIIRKIYSIIKKYSL